MKAITISILSGLLCQAASLAAEGGAAQVGWPDMLQDIYTFAAYSHAAYCPFNYDGVLDNEVCMNEMLAKACGIYGHSTTILELTNQHDISGNIAVNDHQRLIVVSFRGTARFWDWLRDAQFWLADAEEFCQGCHLHHGFYTAFKNVKDEIDKALEQFLGEHQAYRLVVTGHSYGGAVATITGASLRIFGGLTPDIFTYGSPRVGNKAFAEFVSGTSNRTRTARVTNREDLVTVQPPMKFGYEHISPEYWFEAGFEADAEPNNLRQCDTTSFGTCSEQYSYFNPLKLFQRIEDHSGYNRRSEPCPTPKMLIRSDIAEDIAPREEEVKSWTWDREWDGDNRA